MRRNRLFWQVRVERRRWWVGWRQRGSIFTETCSAACMRSNNETCTSSSSTLRYQTPTDRYRLKSCASSLWNAYKLCRQAGRLQHIKTKVWLLFFSLPIEVKEREEWKHFFKNSTMYAKICSIFFPTAAADGGGERCGCSPAEGRFPNSEGHSEPLPLAGEPSPRPGAGNNIYKHVSAACVDSPHLSFKVSQIRFQSLLDAFNLHIYMYLCFCEIRDALKCCSLFHSIHLIFIFNFRYSASYSWLVYIFNSCPLINLNKLRFL